MADFMKDPTGNLAKAQAYYTRSILGKLSSIKNIEGPPPVDGGPLCIQPVVSSAV